MPTFVSRLRSQNEHYSAADWAVVDLDPEACAQLLLMRDAYRAAEAVLKSDGLWAYSVRVSYPPARFYEGYDDRIDDLYDAGSEVVDAGDPRLAVVEGLDPVRPDVEQAYVSETGVSFYVEPKHSGTLHSSDTLSWDVVEGIAQAQPAHA